MIIRIATMWVTAETLRADPLGALPDRPLDSAPPLPEVPRAHLARGRPDPLARSSTPSPRNNLFPTIPLSNNSPFLRSTSLFSASLTLRAMRDTVSGGTALSVGLLPVHWLQMTGASPQHFVGARAGSAVLPPLTAPDNTAALSNSERALLDGMNADGCPTDLGDGSPVHCSVRAMRPGWPHDASTGRIKPYMRTRMSPRLHRNKRLHTDRMRMLRHARPCRAPSSSDARAGMCVAATWSQPGPRNL